MLITPDWPAPNNIKTLSTTRSGGISSPPFDSLNLSQHVGDNIKFVEQNRQALINQAKLPESPRWLKQTHSTKVSLSSTWQAGDKADAIFSNQINHVCPIMTADCLPILLCDQHGQQVAAIHAGWRGLAAGIIEQTLTNFNCPGSQIMAWCGPAIGSQQFKVGLDVVDCFTQHSQQTMEKAFEQVDSIHYLADIFLLAKQRLISQGVSAIFGGEHCTVSDPTHFFSYRRDGATGRMASMIWIEPK